MLARGLIISGRFVQVRTTPKHRSTHISNYQSSERKSNQHDESGSMKFPCALKNTFLFIKDRFGLSFASKGLGYLAALLLLLSLLARYKLPCYQTTPYLEFQHVVIIFPYRFPLTKSASLPSNGARKEPC